MRNGLEDLGNRADKVKEIISDLEDRNLDMIRVKEEKEFRVKKMKQF